MSTTFGERLGAALLRDGRTQAAIEARLGVGSGQVSRWKNGTAQPDMDSVLKLVTELRVNAHWLLTGEGPREVSDEVDAIRLEVIGRIVDGTIDSQTLELLSSGRSASADLARAGRAYVASNQNPREPEPESPQERKGADRA